MASTCIYAYSECFGNRDSVLCKLDKPGVGGMGKKARFWGSWFEDSTHQCESGSNKKKNWEIQDNTIYDYKHPLFFVEIQ
jgi:hypothetical protein